MESNIPQLKLPIYSQNTFLDVAVQSMMRSGLVDPDYVDPSEKSLLVAGNSKSGKTTLINKFLFGTDQRVPNKTKFLEYYSSPSTTWTNDDNYNRTCHVWELEDLAFDKSLRLLEKSPKLTTVLCLDLSQPQFLMYTQDTILEMFRTYASWRKDFEVNKKERLSLIPEDHPDASVITPFPLPLIIVGMKYDLYHEFEPEKKRIISQFIRYLAHVNGAYLFYWSARNPEIVKQVKGLLRYYAYDKEMSSTKKTDYNKAIVIPPFTDKLSDIDSEPEHSFEKYLINLETYFPQENPFTPKVDNNPADDPIYDEPIIDLIRSKAQANWQSGP